VRPNRASEPCVRTVRPTPCVRHRASDTVRVMFTILVAFDESARRKNVVSEEATR
jgi:hypothetical protein